MQQPGLGAYFLNSIHVDLHALGKTAGVHRIVYKNYHRSLAFVDGGSDRSHVWTALTLQRRTDFSEAAWVRQ